MNYKVSEIDGALLDAAVAKALGLRMLGPLRPMACEVPFDIGPDWDNENGDRFEPSSRWAHGGPIIERERIGILPADGHRGSACKTFVYAPSQHDLKLEDAMTNVQFGKTDLVAAMSTYVASRFGDEVELPD